MAHQSPFSLAGKTALVAGASRGIGLAIAKEIAAAGAHTILAARSMDKLQANVEEFKKEGWSAEARALDVSDNAKIEAACQTMPDLDILINVAGTNIRKRFEDYTWEEYENILQTNLHGIVRLTQILGERMKKRDKGGKIIMIGSLTSVIAFPHLSPYAITKSGLWGLTRVLAAEWGRHNIQVNCIAPGFIITDLNRQMWQRQDMLDWLKGGQGNPRPGTPEDIAPLAVFLASPGSNYVTGQCIAVDGGFTTMGVWPFEP
jgi:gluconate 5-dehydrogenase